MGDSGVGERRVASVVSAYESSLANADQEPSHSTPGRKQRAGTARAMSMIQTLRGRRRASEADTTVVWRRHGADDGECDVDTREQIVMFNRQSRMQFHHPLLLDVEPGGEDALRALAALPEPSFDVIKRLSYRRRKPRTLRLTSRGIENVKAGEVTSLHEYETVNRLGVMEGNVVVLSYADTHDYLYESSAAMHIIQQIVLRLSLVQGQETELPSEDYGRLFQLRVIESPGTLDAIGSITAGHVAAIVTAAESHEHADEESDAGSSVGEPAPVGHGQRLRDRLSRLSFRRTASLSPEDQLRTRVSKILQSRCASAISQYISQFKNLERETASAQALTTNVRQFCDGVKDHVIQWAEDELYTLAETIVGPDGTDIEPMRVLNRAIEEAVETVVLAPLFDMLWGAVATCSGDAEEEVNAAIARLASRQQRHFGIKAQHESPSNWLAASKAMRGLADGRAPSAKLGALLKAVGTIFTTFADENEARGHTGEAEILAGDDFLPILIYVIVHTALPSPLVVAEFCWQLCDPTVLASEGGYYLSVFLAALEFLRSGSADVPVEMETNTRRRPPPPPTAAKPVRRKQNC